MCVREREKVERQREMCSVHIVCQQKKANVVLQASERRNLSADEKMFVCDETLETISRR